MRKKHRVVHATNPMHFLHIDGNYKSKRLGFPIYGCVCGFSGIFMWLVVATTTH